MAFVVHNVTSHRVSLQLHPAVKAAPGTPNWQVRRFVRQNTYHVVVEPHRTLDLTSFGYTEREILAQPEVLDCLRVGHLRQVRQGGGGYAENQFQVQDTLAAAEPVPAAPVAVEPTAASLQLPVPDTMDEAAQGQDAPPEELVPVPVPVPHSASRTPFRPKKRR